VASVTLNAGVGSNIFSIAGTLAGTTTTLNGGPGFNEFGIRDANYTMDSLQGALAIHGQPGSDSLVILYDYYNPVGQTYTLSAGLATRSGIAPISYDGLDEVILYTGIAGGNQVNVQSTAAGVLLNLSVSGGDTVYVGQPLNDGSNTATLANILGDVVIGAGTGTPTILVDNSADTSDHQVRTELTGYGVALQGLAPADIYFEVDPASNVQVNPGSGNVTGLDAFFALLGQGAQP
jgi:hypothetical protein